MVYTFFSYGTPNGLGDKYVTTTVLIFSRVHYQVLDRYELHTSEY